MSSLGNLTLELALLFAGLAIFAGLWGCRAGSAALTDLSRRSIYATAALLSLAVLILVTLVFANDFLVRLVHTSSGRDLPWTFKVALLWVDLESSLLFWAWILALVATLAVRLHHRRLPDLTPHAGAVMMLVLGFFIYLLLFQKNPFDEYLAETPLVGNGMRPMLRNPWMLIHPPMQYLGYILTTVPFAYGVAALLRSRKDTVDEDDWLRVMRSWILGGWIFLGVGLVLGMLWAYELVDWGGWWSWDPIENASLFPWLVSTALVHAALVTLRRGGLLRGYTSFLNLLTFWLTIFGTFLTRSGVVRSVHSFGEDQGLLWAFAIFLGLGVVPFGLFIARLVEGRFKARRQSGFVSLEFIFVIVIWTLLAAALVVLGGTLYPTIREAMLGQRITVGPPFFERLLAPLGLTLLCWMAIAPLLSWRAIPLRRLLDQIFWPFVLMVVVIFALPLLYPDLLSDKQRALLRLGPVMLPTVSLIQLSIGLSVLAIATAWSQYLRMVRLHASARGLSRWRALGPVFARHRFRYSAYVVHIGVALMFLGFAGKPLEKKIDRVLTPGDTLRVGSVALEYEGLSFKRGIEASAVQAVVMVRKRDHAAGFAVTPGHLTYYANPRMPVSEPVILRHLGRDLHVRLAGTQDNRVTLKVALHPLVSWMWIGFLVMALGGVFGMIPRAAPRREAQAPRASGLPHAMRLVAVGVAGVWLAALAAYLAGATYARDLPAALSYGATGAAALGVCGVLLWTFVPVVLPDAVAEAPAPIPAPPTPQALSTRLALERDRLVGELQQLEEEVQLGKLDRDTADHLARPLRLELAVVLATQDAEEQRDRLAAQLSADPEETEAPA